MSRSSATKKPVAAAADTSSTALALNAKVTQAVKPPANKREIVKAMALRKFNLLTEQAKKDSDARIDAETELRRLARQNVIANFNSQNGELLCGGSEPKIEMTGRFLAKRPGERYAQYAYDGPVESVMVFLINPVIKAADFTPAMKAQAAIINRINRGRTTHVPELKEIEQDIRRAMTGELTTAESRIEAILSDPAAVKALDKALGRLDEQATPALAAAS